jgi:hypothetical protein
MEQERHDAAQAAGLLYSVSDSDSDSGAVFVTLIVLFLKRFASLVLYF